ncbi:MAG: 2-iminobutanoate/2-iminopropanoate deaminase [Rhodothermales bacterium]|jgi:2-iminobutanoate/2-iminopropanoate deaminase
MPRRKSIDIEGFSHGKQPIPAASRVGNILVTGGVYGLDTGSGEIPDDADRQCEFMFANLKAILEAGGASLESVVKMTFWVKNTDARQEINPLWLKAFPDPDSRPARHTLLNPDLPLNLVLQCDAIAVIL